MHEETERVVNETLYSICFIDTAETGPFTLLRWFHSTRHRSTIADDSSPTRPQIGVDKPQHGSFELWSYFHQLKTIF